MAKKKAGWGWLRHTVVCGETYGAAPRHIVPRDRLNRTLESRIEELERRVEKLEGEAHRRMTVDKRDT